MNLYLLTQDESRVVDTFDSAVVAAESEDEARRIHPQEGWASDVSWGNTVMSGTWAAKPESVSVKLLGVANDGLPRGVVCASFNAG